MDSKHQLELVSHYDDNGEVTKTTWQWRQGRCVSNGVAHTEMEAVIDAEATFCRWETEQLRLGQVRA